MMEEPDYQSFRATGDFRGDLAQLSYLWRRKPEALSWSCLTPLLCPLYPNHDDRAFLFACLICVHSLPPSHSISSSPCNAGPWKPHLSPPRWGVGPSLPDCSRRRCVRKGSFLRGSNGPPSPPGQRLVWFRLPLCTWGWHLADLRQMFVEGRKEGGERGRREGGAQVRLSGFCAVCVLSCRVGGDQGGVTVPRWGLPRGSRQESLSAAVWGPPLPSEPPSPPQQAPEEGKARGREKERLGGRLCCSKTGKSSYRMSLSVPERVRCKNSHPLSAGGASPREMPGT